MGAIFDEAAELVRLKAKGRVWPAIGASEGDVFLDQGRAQGNGAHRRRRARRMVGKAADPAKILCQPWDGAQVGIGETGWISADAVEEGDATCARRHRRRHRLANFGF